MKSKIVLFSLCALLCCAPITGCGDNASSDAAATVDENAVEEADGGAEADAEADSGSVNEASSGTVVFNEENVKLCGRTELIDDTLWCAFSGTGAEFIYNGKGLDITVAGDAAAGTDNQARIAIYVNGERVVDDMIDSSEKSYRVAESDEIAESDIHIVKLSETAQSTIGIKPVTLQEGESIEPMPERELKMEFIGDSITCGYGVDDEDRDHHFATSTEDATKAYAYKTAELMNADYSLVSISGWGIISGYTNDPQKKADKQQIPLYYGKMGYSYQKFAGTKSPQDIDWDFSRFVPDVIVVNLGTNDNSYCKGDKDKRAEYRDGYIEFLKQIREKNPDSEIFCVLGIMGAELFNDMGEAALMYTEETGDEKVHFVALPSQDGSLGYAADWHPTEATHEVAAEYLAEEIEKVLSGE